MQGGVSNNYAGTTGVKQGCPRHPGIYGRPSIKYFSTGQGQVCQGVSWPLSHLSPVLVGGQRSPRVSEKGLPRNNTVYPLSSPYCMPDIVFPYGIATVALGGRCHFYGHFTNKETKAQRGPSDLPRSPSQEGEQIWSDSQPGDLTAGLCCPLPHRGRGRFLCPNSREEAWLIKGHLEARWEPSHPAR